MLPSVERKREDDDLNIILKRASSAWYKRVSVSGFLELSSAVAELLLDMAKENERELKSREESFLQRGNVLFFFFGREGGLRKGSLR